VQVATGTMPADRVSGVRTCNSSAPGACRARRGTRWIRWCDRLVLYCVGVDYVPRNADGGAGAAGHYSSRCKFVLHPTVARRRWLGACRLFCSALALGALRGSSLLSQRGGACVLRQGWKLQSKLAASWRLLGGPAPLEDFQACR
jgi:hypothetical protein